MRLHNVNFDTWESNHESKHQARWSRHLYPFRLLGSLDYDSRNTGRETARGRHKLKLVSIELQDNGRYRATVDVSPNFEVGQNRDKRPNARRKRRWDCRFLVIYTTEGEFITVYTDKEDPTKKFVKSFLKGDIGEAESSKEYNMARLMGEILEPSEKTYPISSSEIKECLDVMRSNPNTLPGIFYYLSAMNLLNAWTNRNQKNKDGEYNFVTDLYHFKTYLSRTIDHCLKHRLKGLGIYIKSDLLILELYGFKFSFHQVKKTGRMKSYEESTENIPIIWEGKMLQPIAPIVLQFARHVAQQNLAAVAENDAAEG